MRMLAKVGILTSIVILIVLREPLLIVEPRLWAEEANVYLHAAMHMEPLSALLAPHLGYYSVVPNAAGVAASVDLRYAAVVTTAVSALLMLLPAMTLLSYRFLWLGWRSRVFLVFFIYLTSPAEIWLNSINSHFYLALNTFLLLIVDEEDLTSVQKAFKYAALLTAGLSGPVSSFLIPAFVLKLHAIGGREVRRSLAVLMACAAIVGISVAVSAVDGDLDRRLRITDLTASSSLLVEPVHYFAGYLGATRVPVIAMVATGLLGFSAFIVSYVSFRREKFFQLLVTALISMGALTLIAALDFRLNPRYVFVTPVILAVLFILCLQRTRQPASMLLLSAWLVVNTLSGIAFFRSSMGNSFSAEWPRWSHEVARYRRGETNFLRAHPARPGRKGDWGLEIDPRVPRGDRG